MFVSRRETTGGACRSQRDNGSHLRRATPRVAVRLALARAGARTDCGGHEIFTRPLEASFAAKRTGCSSMPDSAARGGSASGRARGAPAG